MIPDAVGETASTDITVRVILLAIDEGSIISETKIEATRSVTLTRNGLELSVRGQGEINVEE